MSLLAAQGLPSAAAELGHVYIEGLGTKQDIPRAERFYKFAEKSGYTDSEYCFWTHFGFTLRQVTIPEKFRERLKGQFGNSMKNARTCMYLIREKKFTPKINVWVNGYTDYSICNAKCMYFFSAFQVKEDGAIFPRNNNGRVNRIDFYTPRQDGKSYYWGDDASFEYKK